MNKTQYQSYENKNLIKPQIHIEKDFTTDFEGTLLHGCISDDGDMFHLYIKEGHIHLLTYYYRWGQNNLVEHIKVKKMDADDVVKNKRVYPEASSWDFTLLLAEKGVHVCFGSFNEKVAALKEGSFYPLAFVI